MSEKKNGLEKDEEKRGMNGEAKCSREIERREGR